MASGSEVGWYAMRLIMYFRYALLPDTDWRAIVFTAGRELAEAESAPKAAGAGRRSRGREPAEAECAPEAAGVGRRLLYYWHIGIPREA